MTGNKIHETRLMIIFFTFLVNISSLFCYEKTPLLFVAFENNGSTRLYDLLIPLYTEAFDRMGYNFQYEKVPGKRAEILSSSGAVDGELLRNEIYGENYPEMIKVDEPVFQFDISVYTNRNDIPEINSWNDLKKQNYLCIYLGGFAVIEEKIENYLPVNNFYSVKTNEQGIEMLLNGRADLFLGYINVYQIRENKEKIKQIGVIETIYTYLWLHPRNAELAPELAHILAAMKKESQYSDSWVQLGIK